MWTECPYTAPFSPGISYRRWRARRATWRGKRATYRICPEERRAPHSHFLPRRSRSTLCPDSLMNSLRWLDLVVIAAYFVGMLAIGLRFSRRQLTTDDYFVAGRSIPSWAMGISVFATLISSITFVAYPGNAFGGNWAELVPGFMVVIVLLLVGTVIVPFFRQVVKMSA